MPSPIVQTPLGADMDITSYKLRGASLRKQILKDIQDDQGLPTVKRRNLPNRLFITRNQFKALEHDLLSVGKTKDKRKNRIYVTEANAMEVNVV